MTYKEMRLKKLKEEDRKQREFYEERLRLNPRLRANKKLNT